MILYPVVSRLYYKLPFAVKRHGHILAVHNINQKQYFNFCTNIYMHIAYYTLYVTIIQALMVDRCFCVLRKVSFCHRDFFSVIGRDTKCCKITENDS